MPTYSLSPAQKRILASIIGGIGMGIIGGTTEGIVGSVAQARFQRHLAQLQQKQKRKKKKKKAKHLVHRRLKKHATEEDVQRIFEDQGTDPEMPPLQPRNEGWRVVKEELVEEPGGMTIQKTTRVRTFGRLHKLAFVRGFVDEFAKNVAEKGAQNLPSSVFYGAENGASGQTKTAFVGKLIQAYGQHRQREAIKNIVRRLGHLGAAVAIGAGAHHILVARRRKKEHPAELKTATEKTPVLLEPHLRSKTHEAQTDPFYAIRNKLRIMAGQNRPSAGGPTVPVARTVKRIVM